MPTLTDTADRHTIIDRRDWEYICFPDVICSDGRLVVAYNESDQHVTPNKRDLIVRTSDDGGHTWSDRVRVDIRMSHCPRLAVLPDKTLHMTSNHFYHHFSHDNGLTWDIRKMAGLGHDMIDRVVQAEDAWLTTGHVHRGKYPQPAIRQAPAEQMVYRSEDQGGHWYPVSAISRARNLVLCEASMVKLPDGRLLALMRENSFVYEPMYACISADDGGTWTDPMPTPLIGHRPTIGLTSAGQLLVTYRDVSPDMGTRAWLGSLDELLSDFQVHGRHENPANPRQTDQGLRISNTAGEDSVVRYALRPLTDTRSATATLEAEVRVDEAQKNGCGIRLGVWWRIFPDRIQPEGENRAPITIEPGCFNTLTLRYAGGAVTLSVNGEERATVEVDDDHADTRPILFGAPYPFEDNAVDATWKRMSLTIHEPHLQRDYAWAWDFQDGQPDQWVQDNVLELKNDRYAAAPDFGYSGWAELEDGTFFCAYHHGGGTDEGYDPMFTSHVMGTRFSADDFK